MKKIEALVKQYDKAMKKALSIVEDINNNVVFEDFGDEKPSITISADGLVAEWNDRILSIDDVAMIMAGRGYIERNDFEIFGY